MQRFTMRDAEELIDYQGLQMLERVNLHKSWRKHAFLLYDAIHTTSMEEASPIIKWKPTRIYDTQDVFILSTDLPQEGDNYLKVFTVPKRGIRATEIYRVKTGSRVNKLAFNPASPDLFATQGQSGVVDIFCMNENLPQLVSNVDTHSSEGFGICWNNQLSYLLLVSSGNKIDIIDVACQL